MQLATLNEFDTRGMDWVIERAKMLKKPERPALSRAEAMKIAHEFVANPENYIGGRYQVLPGDRIGMKLHQIYTKVNSGGKEDYYTQQAPLIHRRAYQEVNQQIMGRNRLRAIGIKVPEVYGIMYVRQGTSWYLAIFMEHLTQPTIQHTKHSGDWDDKYRLRLGWVIQSVGAGHGDLHSSNTMVDDEGRLAIIDWEGVRIFGTLTNKEQHIYNTRELARRVDRRFYRVRAGTEIDR